MKKIPHICNLAKLFVCTLLLSSCVDEITTMCPEEIRVYFTFSSQAGGGAINPADVDRMHLYVFDRNGYYVGEYRDEQIANFNTDYYMDCSDLLPGKYRFIAWGGQDARNYTTLPQPFVKGQTTFDQALLELEHPANTVTFLHHIFHSDLAATVVADQPRQHFTMPLAQISNTIHIRTVGLPASANTYRFNIADNNCTYKFDTSFAPDPDATFTYTSTCSKDAESQLFASLNVLRLAAGRHTPQLEIHNQTADKPLYPTGTQSGDLIGLILSAYPQNNFDTTHTYDIVLTFKGDGSTGFTVSVSINGWEVHEQNGEVLID